MAARKVSETEELLRLLAMLGGQMEVAQGIKASGGAVYHAGSWHAGMYAGLALAHGELKAICERRLKKQRKRAGLA